MSVTFFNDGLTVEDGAAARLSAFCEDVALGLYTSQHDGEPPPGWPSNSAKKILIEWSIKFLIANRVRAWERQIAQEAVTTDPWEGMTKQ